MNKKFFIPGINDTDDAEKTYSVLQGYFVTSGLYIRDKRICSISTNIQLVKVVYEVGEKMIDRDHLITAIFEGEWHFFLNFDWHIGRRSHPHMIDRKDVTEISYFI